MGGVCLQDGALEVWASTQNPTKTQNFCAYVCGVPANRVVCRMKRMGGGFGGKETRSVFISCAAALAAHLTGRPVRVTLDRDVDMLITGQRHAFVARYRAAAAPDTGRLLALDAQLFNNGGFSMDLSGPVADRALFHIDNCYRWPSLRARGRIVRTHQASHTAFRGFGGPQVKGGREASKKRWLCVRVCAACTYGLWRPQSSSAPLSHME